MKPKKETIVVSPEGVIYLPEWVWKLLLKQSGSKAKTVSGQRKAIKKLLMKEIEESSKSK